MKTLAEKIAVMQAAERGEAIETRVHVGGAWLRRVALVEWDWKHCDYRIAPKAPREVAMLFDRNGVLGANKCRSVIGLVGDEPTPTGYARFREVLDEPAIDGALERVAAEMARERNGADYYIDGKHGPRATRVSAAKPPLLEYGARINSRGRIMAIQREPDETLTWLDEAMDASEQLTDVVLAVLRP